MKPGKARKRWGSNPSKISPGSMWRVARSPSRSDEQWKVTARYKFEAGAGSEMNAVRIHCGNAHGRVRSMSEARFLRLFVRALDLK